MSVAAVGGVRFDHRDAGTPEAAWRRAAPWRAAPELELTDVDRLVVLSAHPDDETLGAGGLLARAARLGADVRVVVATDGESSHPGADPRALARRRREELLRAVGVLAPRASVTFLAAPDGGLREARAAVAAAVGAIVGTDETRDAARTLVAAPWWGDGHRDHRVLGEIALTLAGDGVSVVGYPIWLWHWGDPAGVDTSGWRVLRLDAAAAAAKRDAIAQHASQLHPDPARPADGPVLHERMRAHFDRGLEVFVSPGEREAGR